MIRSAFVNFNEIKKEIIMWLQCFLMFLFCLYFQWIEAKSSDGKTVCLNMIVKNESSVIRRSMGSAKSFIDYWVVVDTGSTDGTQEIIKDFMKDIPGELHERPWVNFGHNRNEALKLAKGKADYVLIIDADDEFVISSDFKLPELDKDSYLMRIDYADLVYYRPHLIKNKLPWRWEGVLHEYLTVDKANHFGPILQGIACKITNDGARSQDPQKMLKDIEILKNALKTEPNNARYVFYLAQSYKDANLYEESIETYKKRANMGDWDQEIYWSLLQVAILQGLLKKPYNEVVSSYFKAYAERPSRVETLYHLANYHRTIGDFPGCYLFSKMGLAGQLPTEDVLFVEKWVYDYAILLEYSIAAYWVGEYEEALQSSNSLLAKSKLPENVRECVKKNLTWILPKIQENTQQRLKSLSTK